MTALVSIITPVKAKSEQDIGWLKECIESVLEQGNGSWELLIVNDHSKVSLASLADYFTGDERIKGYAAEGHGVANARNQAARESTTGLLLPLDHDDKLAPGALTQLLGGWSTCGNGVIYGDTIMFGTDMSRVYHSPPFDPAMMLKQLLLPVGALHSKAAWQQSGGWKSTMDLGLEDWEYWLTLMENGHCGHHIKAITYYYRRHPDSRLANLLARDNGYKTAYSQMRDIHADLFAGRIKVMCAPCSGGGGMASAPQRAASTQLTAMQVSQMPVATRVRVVYNGRRRATFFLTGRPSGARYEVSGIGSEVIGPDGRPGVLPQDVAHLLRLDAGSSFAKL